MAWNPRDVLSSGAGMKLGMVACCAVMLVPLGAFLVAGRTLGGLAGNIGLLAPLALCLGAHVVMHRMMGRSCHDSTTNTQKEASDEDPGQGPAVVLVHATR